LDWVQPHGSIWPPEFTDMRKGFEGLYGLVRDRLSCEPLSGHLFLFCMTRGEREARSSKFYPGALRVADKPSGTHSHYFPQPYFQCLASYSRSWT
jgi:hypothetical protein